ncbi:MAG: cupredoxin domain-containing protein [Bdellovibrionales bacterium]|nr:cupredoxin domain-containing protein [Bdellovibrionales bacterium]
MEYRAPASAQPAVQDEGFFDSLFTSGEPVQEMVILNTPTGFVPSTLNVKVGGNYKLYVVNVNEEKKNVSFVMDAFSEHHATYYGNIKSFHISPKKDGIFSFVCPETSAQGRLVVYPGANPQAPQVRLPASE